MIFGKKNIGKTGNIPFCNSGTRSWTGQYLHTQFCRTKFDIFTIFSFLQEGGWRLRMEEKEAILVAFSSHFYFYFFLLSQEEGKQRAKSLIIRAKFSWNKGTNLAKSGSLNREKKSAFYQKVCHILNFHIRAKKNQNK